MSVYQPLWHYGRKVINEYRYAIEEQIAMRRHDEFLLKQEQRHRIVKRIRTVKENSFSDHRPKELITRAVARPRILTIREERISINHVVLKEPQKKEELKEKTERAM